MGKGIKSAFAWSALEHMGQNMAGFVMGVVLARLLSPAEFGLTGMLTIFFAVSTTFTNAGLGSALIQRKDLTADDTTSCFYLNITAGVILAGLLCVISPWVAEFYGVTVLRPMLCVLSVTVVFGSLSIVQNSLRSRDLDFKTLAIANWSATLLAGTVGIVMAWQGFGVWSLVVQGVVGSFLRMLLLWAMRPWRPRGTFRWSSIRRLWSFSSRLLAAGLLDAVFRHSYSVVIGRVYSPAELGLFTRARGLNETASHALSTVVGRVAFPYFSRHQTDRDLVKLRLRQFLRLTATFQFPFMIGMAAVAPALVTAVLTEKWVACVPLLQVLSFAGLLYPLHVYHLQILNSQGRSDLFFRLEVIKKLMVVLNLVITTQFGVFAMSCGMATTSFVAYWLNSYYTRRLLGYSWQEQCADLSPMLMAALVSGGGALAVGWTAWPNAWITLVMQILAGSLAYLGMVFGFRRTWFADAFEVVVRIPGCPRWLSRLSLA